MNRRSISQLRLYSSFTDLGGPYLTQIFPPSISQLWSGISVSSSLQNSSTDSYPSLVRLLSEDTLPLIEVYRPLPNRP